MKRGRAMLRVNRRRGRRWHPAGHGHNKRRVGTPTETAGHCPGPRTIPFEGSARQDMFRRTVGHFYYNPTTNSNPSGRQASCW